MRKCRMLAVLLLAVLLLCACDATGDPVPYTDEDHKHIYGHWYDVVPVSCVQAGTQVRYCKLCHAEQTGSVQIPEDREKQLHDFSDTVIPPTEKDWGYTTRVCKSCSYAVSSAFPIAPLYALLTEDTTCTTPPDGVEELLLSHTKTHTVSHLTGRDTEINAELLRRLAVAIPLVERMTAEGESITLDTALAVTQTMLEGTSSATEGIYVGATVTARQLLGLFLDSGGADALSCLVALTGETKSDFSDTVTARSALLGVTLSYEDLADAATFEGVTLYDTAVLIAKALDMEPLRALLSENTNPHLTLSGVRPVLYFTAARLRVSAIPQGDGYAFLLLCGERLDGALENTLYGA